MGERADRILRAISGITEMTATMTRNIIRDDHRALRWDVENVRGWLGDIIEELDEYEAALNSVQAAEQAEGVIP